MSRTVRDAPGTASNKAGEDEPPPVRARTHFGGAAWMAAMSREVSASETMTGTGDSRGDVGREQLGFAVPQDVQCLGGRLRGAQPVEETGLLREPGQSGE